MMSVLLSTLPNGTSMCCGVQGAALRADGTIEQLGSWAAALMLLMLGSLE
jgi:hypothetical protein